MAVTAAEILQDIEDYILTGGRRTRADKLRMILDKLVELTEQGGSGDFGSLTGSPYDNINLGNVLDSKQDRINGIVSGCDISVGSYGGLGSNNDVKVTSGTWYITPSEYTKGTDTLLLDIALCSAGLLKYVDVIGDNTNTITIVDGAESTSPQHYVINPATEVLLGYILISDSVIEAPTPILTSLTKKFEDMGSRIGSFTLDCETKDFPSFTVRLDGVTWGTFTLNFLNFLNVVEGTIYLDIISTSTLNLPATSYESGSIITSKTFSIGTYKVTFSYLYGEYFFDFALASGVSLTQASQAQVEASFDNTDQTTPTTLEQTSVLTPFNTWWLVQKIKAWVVGKIGGVITDSGVISAITTPSNYNDSYGNASPALGGVWNTSLPSPISEGQYYIEPVGTPDGFPRHKIEVKKNSTGSVLTIIKTPYIQ